MVKLFRENSNYFKKNLTILKIVRVFEIVRVFTKHTQQGSSNLPSVEGIISKFALFSIQLLAINSLKGVCTINAC